ncbi:MAG TPA: hypothetical protein VGS61_00300, partial [Acidimicrobiales bacterium]|nr:hypothetical protein [Acidimicrobiales bacterium]
GDPLHEVPLQPRTGLGVDARGTLIDVATMDPVDALDVARALVDAGAVVGMQLDINPYWPIQGAASRPRHAPTGLYAVQLPGATHSALVYDSGWIRDFFVALAEPDSWSCAWRAPGLRRGGAARPQPLREACAQPQSGRATH